MDESPQKSDSELRAESNTRLSTGRQRIADKPPFWEQVINHFPIKKSYIYQVLFKLAGIKIGENVKFLGAIKVKLRGKPENIVIEDNVILGHNADLRNRENGKITLKQNSYLDEDVRIVAARDGSVYVDFGTEIGKGTIINSGGNTKIGKHCLIANNCNINSSSHGIKKQQFIKEQAHEHGYVTLGDDVWIGGFSTVTMNTAIGEGAILGANSLARGEIPEFAIAVGAPAKVIKYRQ